MSPGVMGAITVFWRVGTSSTVTTISCKGKADEVAKTDNYGDFEFEGLDAEKDYTVSIEHNGYSGKKVKVRTSIDTYLGEILLSRMTDRNK